MAISLEQERDQLIDLLTDALAGPDLYEETFQSKAGRLMAARASALEVAAQLLDEPSEEPEPETPEDRALFEAMTEFQEASAELAQLNRRSRLAEMPILPPRPA